MKGEQILLCTAHGELFTPAQRRAMTEGETIPEAIAALCTLHSEAAHARAYREDACELAPTLGHGWCVGCHAFVPEAMTIALVESGSGPGGTVLACVPHAQEFSTLTIAPDWLRADLARLDEERASRLGSAS
ncbi:hypothetical protein [Streptomyces albiaxialis]|uniref:hypothetical protein n=1 Tax=Streptomyces albiaxialis TaxID=329523 RepID=UPI0031E1991E